MFIEIISQLIFYAQFSSLTTPPDTRVDPIEIISLIFYAYFGSLAGSLPADRHKHLDIKKDYIDSLTSYITSHTHNSLLLRTPTVNKTRN